MPRSESTGRARFWRRSRGWPPARQIAFAAVVGLIVAGAIGVITSQGGAKHAGTTAASITTGTSATARIVATTMATTTVITHPAATTTTTVGSSATHLVALTIAAPSHRDTYDRTADFGGWLDVHGCQNTRATLLISRSQVPVTFTTARDCAVETGRWIDPWSGVVATRAISLQIDHTVPLGNAWRSGAWSWTHAQRVAYANDLADADHLVPILAHENELKRDDGPNGWRPPSRTAWCRYALDWDRIKARWQLTATPNEWAALREMYATC